MCIVYELTLIFNGYLIGDADYPFRAEMPIKKAKNKSVQTGQIVE